jgi:hypothetical protein
VELAGLRARVNHPFTASQIPAVHWFFYRNGIGEANRDRTDLPSPINQWQVFIQNKKMCF